MVQLLRKDVVSLCESLGFKTASKWNKARMAEKLVEISELAGGDGEAGVELEDEDQKKLLQKIIKVGGKVDVVQVLDEETEEEAKPEKSMTAEGDEEDYEEEETEEEAKPEKSMTAEGDEEDYEEEENEEAAEINAEINKAVKDDSKTGKAKAKKEKVKAEKVKAEKPPKEKKVKENNRRMLTLKGVANLTETTSFTKLAETLDEKFVEGGGTSNVTTMRGYLHTAVVAGIAFGKCTLVDDKIVVE